MFRWPAYFRMFRSHISGLHWAFEQSGQTGPWFCPAPFQICNQFCDVVQQDLATQVFYWDHYKSLCRKMSLERGRFLRPEVGEYLAGHMHAQMVIFGYHCMLLPICSVRSVRCQFVQISALPRTPKGMVQASLWISLPAAVSRPLWSGGSFSVQVGIRNGLNL